MQPVTQGVFICTECQKDCQAIRSNANPMSSEWYCTPCHKSYPYYEQAPQEEEKPTRKR